jgi:cytoskeleton protein RodZ
LPACRQDAQRHNGHSDGFPDGTNRLSCSEIGPEYRFSPFLTEPALPVESMVQNAGMSVGGLLRSRREELGQDTESVSRQLRIRSIYIRAIEEGRMQDLPGTAYAVGFVRTYADFLGFDGNSVVASYRDELGQRGRPETVNWHIEDKDGGFPFGKLLIILVVVAAAGYGLWYYLANTQSGVGLIEAVPEYLKKSTGTDKAASPATGQSTASPAPASQPAGSTPPAGAASGSSSEATPAAGSATDAQASTGTQPPAATPAPAQDAAAAPASPASTTSTTSVTSPGTVAPAPAGQAPAGQATTPTNTAPVSSTPAVTANGQAPATATAPAAVQTAAVPTTPQAGSEAAPDVAAAATSSTTRISVHAKLESWVQINDKDGKSVMSRVLRAGETYAVPDQKGLILNTGNAGGIEVIIDGKTLPSLGSIGLVKRNIALDADKLSNGGLPAKAPATKAEPAADGTTGGTTTGD